MPYIYRCDYCGNEKEFKLGATADLDLERRCVECNEEICVACVSRQGECWNCHENRYAREDMR